MLCFSGKISTIVVLCFLLTSCSDDNEESYGNIYSGGTEVIERELSKLDKNSLVLWDCDDVLLTYCDQILNRNYKNNLKKSMLVALIYKPTTLFKMSYLRSIVLLSAKRRVVNNKIPKIIDNLQKSGFKTLVITAMKEEKTGEINSLVLWRKNELESFGYDFSKQWEWLGNGKISDDGVYYGYGIICSNPADKGSALELFLKHSKTKVSGIILVDDYLKSLKDVQKISKKLGIKFVGIHFKHAAQYDPNFSQKRSDFQLIYLRDKEIWLSEKEADEKMLSAN